MAISEAVWQRCHVHFLRNALNYLPRKTDDDSPQELRWLYDQRDLQEANHDLSAWVGKWQAKYPKFVGWGESDIGETLTPYRLPRLEERCRCKAEMLQPPRSGSVRPIERAV